MKQLYTTLVLLLAAAGVGGWIYFNERGPVAQTGSTVLLRLEPEQVSTLTLRTQSGERLEFSRQNSQWRVKSNGLNELAVPADALLLQSLLEALRLVQSGAVVGSKASPSELASYGLDKPRSTLATGEAKIEFGDKPSFDVTKIYARVTSNFNRDGVSQIALLPAELADYTFKNLDDWRDKSILNIDAKNVLSFTIQSPAAKASFVRDAHNLLGNSGEWKMVSPLKSLGDAALITLLLQQLPQIKTAKFLEDIPANKARWGLDKPTARMEVTTEQGRSTLVVGKQAGGGWAAQNSASKAVFVLPSEVFALISRPLRDWRDKSVLKLNTGRLQTMKVQARGKLMEFAQIEGKWQRKDGAATEKSSIAALEIGFALQVLKATDFINKPQSLIPYGLNKPVLQLQLTSEEWSGVRTIQLGRAKGKIFARVLGQPSFSPTILLLPPDALDGFQVSLDVLFSTPKSKSIKSP